MVFDFNHVKVACQQLEDPMNDRVIPNFIVLEGVGGVGKTSLLNALRQAVKAYLSWEVDFIWFPSKRPVGALIRKVLENAGSAGCVAPQTLAPLFLGDMLDMVH